MTDFEKETVGFFDKFYRKTGPLRSGKTDSVRAMEDFFNKNYYFKVKKFLPPRVRTGNKIRILDLGCGDGNYIFHLYLQKDKGEFYAADISPEAIKKAKEIAKSNGAKIDFSVQNGKNLKYKNEFFDYVYVVSVLHHTNDYFKIVEEVKRVLKKGGKFIIVDLQKDSYFSRLGRKILCYAPKKIKNILFEGDLLVEDDFPERSNLSSKGLKSYLKKNGLKVIEEEYHYLFFSYFYYFYRLMPFLFKPLMPLNLLIMNLENKIKNRLKYKCELFVFVCIKE